MLSNEAVVRLGEVLKVARGNISEWGGPYQVDEARREILDALPELLRVYRAWLDAPAVDVEAGAGCLVAEMVVPEVWTQLDGQRIRLVRDGDSGEGMK